MSLFCIFFPGRTPVLADNIFRQVDSTHSVLDVTSSLAPLNPQDLKEVGFSLIRPNCLPPDAALSLYVSTDGGTWGFRGWISNDHPSDVLPLSWHDAGSDGQVTSTGVSQIGISLEPLAEVTQKEGMKLAHKEEFAKRVGLDLFNFMQSFADVRKVSTDQLLVPANVLDRWFQRLSTKLAKDPDFLTRSKEAI